MLASLLRGICRCLFRVKVKGLENVPAQNQLLMVANHESFLDGLLLGLFIPKRATFVVHTGVLKNWLFRQFLKLTPHLAVNPASPMAMKKVIKRLKAGENVVIFPEGRITVTGALMKVYDGPGFIAAKTGVNVLPIHVHGAAQSYFGRLSDDYPKKLFPKVTLTVLPLETIAVPEHDAETQMRIPNKQRRMIAGEKMRRVMQTMMFTTRKQQTFYEAFLDAADLYGKHKMMVEDINETEESYQDLIKKSMALGRIASKVSQANEAVGVLMPNVNNTMALILGMSAHKRIPAMLNYTAGAAGIQNACIAADIKTIITSRQFIATAKLEAVIGELTDLNIVYLEEMRSTFTLWDKLWLMAYAIHFPRAAMQQAAPEDIGVILFTSGSEGKPKGVVHSHTSILANIKQVTSTLEFNPTDKFMMALPIFHSFGFTGALLPLFNGIPVHLFPSPLMYKVIPEVIYDKTCTVFFSTNTFLANYAKFAHPYDFYKLRYVVAGAEKLSDEVRKLYQEKFGIRVLEGYGTTECAPVVSANSPMNYRKGSVGQFMPGMDYQLEIVDGIEEGGLLHVKGDNIMKGYYLYDEPAKLVPPENGWYETGDIVSVDDDGFLFIKGRVKRFAKVAGEMVSLEVVEKIARQVSEAHQHAASTNADEKRGENIILFTTDEHLKREDLLAEAKKAGQPELAVPRQIIHIEAIPLLGTGKTDYVTLKQLAAA